MDIFDQCLDILLLAISAEGVKCVCTPVLVLIRAKLSHTQIEIQLRDFNNAIMCFVMDFLFVCVFVHVSGE